MLYIFLGAFLILIIVLTVAEAEIRKKRRSETCRHAHERVVDLRRSGMRAEICSSCKGRGLPVRSSTDCKACDGIGYTYDLPAVD